MDLSKAFDCIPHDLLIAQPLIYGLIIDTVTSIYSYLKERKQKVKINNNCGTLLTILSGKLEEFILGPILFNILLNDPFFV